MDADMIAVREAVQQIKAKYCYYLDYKDWDQYADLFSFDATLDVDSSVSTRGQHANPLPQVCGRSAIRAYMHSLDSAETVHQVHSPIFEEESLTSIKAIWAMEDIVRMPGFHIEGRGHYRERYVIEDGEWKIASLHLTRTWINVVEGDERGPTAR